MPIFYAQASDQAKLLRAAIDERKEDLIDREELAQELEIVAKRS